MHKEGLRGTRAPNGPGTPALGGRGVLPRRWWKAVVGALGGPAGVRSSQRPRHTSLEERGVLPSWWWVLKEGLRGVAFPNGPGRGVLPRRWLVL